MESLKWVSSSSSEAILATAGGVAGQAEDFISIRGRLSHDRRHLGDIPLGESRTGNRCVFLFCFFFGSGQVLAASIFVSCFFCLFWCDLRWSKFFRDFERFGPSISVLLLSFLVEGEACLKP